MQGNNTDKSGKEIKPLSNDEQLNTSSTGETITPAAETPEIINPTSEIKDMEVHHHAHDPAAPHHKKNWKSYFWEFLMLFLAVFCGFLAEYQLEHKIERDREKQFINSLVADLQDDVKNLDSMMKFEKSGVEILDSLINLLNDPALAKQNGDQLYFAARLGPRSNPFANNSRTFDQLKNAGGFRLIRYPEASNNIMGYYNQLSQIRLLEDNYNHEFDNYKRIGAKILDPGILRRQESGKGEILRSNDNPSLVTYDMELLKELGFHTLQMNGSRRSKILLLETMKQSGEYLVSYLKNKYHLQ